MWTVWSYINKYAGYLATNEMSSCRDIVSMLVHAYNCTRSTATGFRSYDLMYGQKSWHTVDLYFSTQKADMTATTSTKFVQQLCERPKSSYKTSQHVIEKEIKRHKWNYKHKIRCTQLVVNDMDCLKRIALGASIKSRIIGKIPYIMLRGNNMQHCQFSRSPKLQGKVRWKLYNENCYSHLEAASRGVLRMREVDKMPTDL